MSDDKQRTSGKQRATAKQRVSVKLILVDAGTPDDAPWVNRLRRALKVLLRSFSLRCSSVQMADDEPVNQEDPPVDE